MNITLNWMPFALSRNHVVAQSRYAQLSAAATELAGPTITPARFPHDLSRRPDLAGEAAVYEALGHALPAATHIFYNRTAKGARRQIDFLVLIPDRGLVAIEVKGGMVHSRRGTFRQTTHTVQGQRSHRKRIEPFSQVKLALDQLWAKSGISPVAIPTFIMAAFPKMSQNAYPWDAAPHILTREDFEEPDRLAKRIIEALPRQPHSLGALEALYAALIANMLRTTIMP